MHHTQKKKFLNMKESGATQEEIRAEMAAAEIEPAEIDAFLSEAFSPDREQKGDTSEEPTDLGHPIYEEWKMAVNNESGDQVLEKVKKVKDVKIDHIRAARLNEQAMNRRIQYFLKEN